ncbi:AraC family transcriptional regulator [Litorivivens sp.]|uniref:AraC family transcriptional regulator n=1 Tax=Litorivivens sp. TaxID=2020868 RepID=UPI003563DBCE
MREINSHQLALRPAVGLQLLCQTLDELGLEAEQVCKQTGLSRRDLDTPGQLIARNDEVRFIEATLAAVDRPDLAFRVGMRYHFGVFGVWGLALATSRDLSQALEVAQEFIELTHSFAGLSVQMQGNQAQIGIEQDYPDGPVQAFVLERDLMVTLMIASEIAGRRLPVERVDIALPEPAHSAMLSRLLDCEVRWRSDHTAAIISLAELGKPLPQANPITWSACVRQCRELVARQGGEEPFSLKVRAAITRSRFRGIGAVCDYLQLSERSLRRRLSDEGTSFREIQQALRLELAEQYLADHSLSLEQVAERLGYSEAANFCHAFRNWTGRTPSSLRKQNQRLSHKDR